MLTYPVRGGVLDTLQWEACREGVTDVRYLTTMYAALRECKDAHIAKPLVGEAEAYVKTFLTKPLANLPEGPVRHVPQPRRHLRHPPACLSRRLQQSPRHPLVYSPARLFSYSQTPPAVPGAFCATLALCKKQSIEQEPPMLLLPRRMAMFLTCLPGCPAIRLNCTRFPARLGPSKTILFGMNLCRQWTMSGAK